MKESAIVDKKRSIKTHHCDNETDDNDKDYRYDDDIGITMNAMVVMMRGIIIMI